MKSKRRMRTPGAFAVAAMLALVLVACGSSSDSSSSGGSGGNSTAAGSGSSGSIKIGMVCECTVGFLAAGDIQTAAGVQVWAKAINAAGGINGHKVDLITYDDQGDPAKSVANAHKAIDNDKVAALIDLTSSDTGWAAYVDSKKVPVIGLAAYNPAVYGKYPMFFAANIMQPGFSFSAAQSLKDRGAAKTAIITCAETPACVATVTPFQKFAKAVGAPSAFTGKAAAAATSYAAQCLGAKQAGAQGVYLAMSSDVGIRVIDSCAQQGYKPQFFVGGGFIPISAWADKAVAGHLSSSAGGFPWATATTPEVQKLIDAVTKYEPKYLKERSPNISAGWTAGKMFEKALASAKGEVTSQTVLDGLLAFNNETLDGLSMASLKFNKSGPQPMMPCTFVVETGNLPFKGIGQAVCVPENLVKEGGIPAPGGVLAATTS
jgi:branched-chain amino acid transport system substrate-binding protein